MYQLSTQYIEHGQDNFWDQKGHNSFKNWQNSLKLEFDL